MMNLGIRNAVVATALSLSLAPLANATPLKTLQINPANQGSQPRTSLVVAQSLSGSSFSPKVQMYVELFSMYTHMMKMGEEMMKSSDPEAKKMGEAMVENSKLQLSKLEKMIRAEFLGNPDK